MDEATASPQTWDEMPEPKYEPPPRAVRQPEWLLLWRSHAINLFDVSTWQNEYVFDAAAPSTADGSTDEH